ncbi:esterase/lipase family protein [Janthinobacterium agaricidamnosum]|uniref:GPI inositol-deacylase PGAP1-like alpha/beta domain-containing protein n=1 Tax=Janthinobacterium agaricidamnosum NBRC 102515 = DSM 9628 TaxID=1349767 RepID=W0VAW7_9BURK|nr:hypothetical protein [Janthinobacterium agaricidamnosum]CDG84417.1 hypothetical protein GJA_3803 [Janthinobacterium agaricidamnosum NBRC 102515 = DSM 9628]
MPQVAQAIPDTRTITVVMRRMFALFDEEERRSFIDDLSLLTGCLPEDMLNLSFRPGCVIFQGDLDAVAVGRLLALYGAMSDDYHSPEVERLQAFLEKHGVSKIAASLELTVHLPQSSAATEQKPLAVLVHGWNGDGNSFGKLPHYLEQLVDCEVAVFPYASSWWKHSPSIYFVARSLDNWTGRKAEAGRKIAFIAHSMGGIVVRRLMLLQGELPGGGFERQVRGITFIASPHNGAVLASLGRQIPGLKSVQLDELSPNSSVLFELNIQWDQWVRSNVPACCKVRSIFGTADAIVSVNDARGLDPAAVPILGAGHSDIVQCASEEDEVVLTVLQFLRHAGFSLLDKAASAH